MVLERTPQLERVRLIYLFMVWDQEVEVVEEVVVVLKVTEHPSFLERL